MFNTQMPYIQQNTQWFQGRLNQGSRDGSLTGLEQGVVRRELHEFRQDQREARADGVVTPGERRELWSEAAHINRDIFSLRHNDLGSMGPGGANAHCPHLRDANHPLY